MALKKVVSHIVGGIKVVTQVNLVEEEVDK